MFKGSWKTTVLGIIVAAAGGIAVAYKGTVIGDIAGIVSLIATGAIGVVARDNNKSSEDVGAK